jgi:RimJ/RimL family protein N-acetyltransferase
MFKDFGDGISSSLSDSDVTLNHLFWARQKLVNNLAEKNKDYVEKYKLKSKNIKIIKTFEILYKQTLVGSIAFWETENKETAISFWVDSDYYRKGIASKAVSLATNYIFKETDTESIIAHVADTNVASKELMLKKGFVPIHRKVLSLINGDVSHTVYRLDK